MENLKDIAGLALDRAIETTAQQVVQNMVVVQGYALHGEIKQLLLNRVRELIQTDKRIDQMLRQQLMHFLLAKTVTVPSDDDND